jgi:hypothetical protein
LRNKPYSHGARHGVGHAIGQESVSGKFGHRADNGEDTWFYYDYKITTKNGTIGKAYYKEKLMSKNEVSEMKDALEQMIDEIKDARDESMAQSQQSVIEAERSVQEAKRSVREAQRSVLESQKAIQNRSIGMSNDKEGKALSWFLKQLLEEKYYEVGKKTEFSITKKGMKVEGKAISNTIFERYKSNLERILGRSLSDDFKFSFKGKVNSVNGDSFNTEGEITVIGD